MIPRLSPPISIIELPYALGKGASVEAFEAAFAKLASCKHAVAFPYGRTALMCLLEALGVKQQKVICPGYTCVVVPHAISFSANEPVFVDCEEDSFLMDLSLAEQAISEEKEVGALIATSIFGAPVSVDELHNISNKHPDLPIIQDCAHSFLCEDRGRPVHKCGIAAIYGLNFSKIITSVFGGMITTDDSVLAERLIEVRQERIKESDVRKSISRRMYYAAALIGLWPLVFGGVKFLERKGLLDRFVQYYRETEIDMPKDYLSALTGFEAAVGIRQCQRYDSVIAHRRAVASRYDQGLKECSDLILPPPVSGHTYSHYTVIARQPEKYLVSLDRAGIELGVLLEYFNPRIAAYKNCTFYNRNRADKFLGKILNLPVHLGMRPRDVERVISCMREASQNG